MEQYKDIHIGKHIKNLVNILEIKPQRISDFLKCTPADIKHMYIQKSLDSDLLLKWSKLLNYNLFAFYQTHLQIYAPNASVAKIKQKRKDPKRKYYFKKNYYSPEIKNFIVDKILKENYSVIDVMTRYNIPKTTIYRWIRKSEQHQSDDQTESKTSSEPDSKSTVISNQVKLLAYKQIYLDMISTLKLTKKLHQTLTTEAQSLSNYHEVIQLNTKIKDQLIKPNNLKTEQQLKSYDLPKILTILREQKRNNVSNSTTAKTYKMSRNTLIRWKHVFGDLV